MSAAGCDCGKPSAGHACRCCVCTSACKVRSESRVPSSTIIFKSPQTHAHFFRPCSRYVLGASYRAAQVHVRRLAAAWGRACATGCALTAAAADAPQHAAAVEEEAPAAAAALPREAEAAASARPAAPAWVAPPTATLPAAAAGTAWATVGRGRRAAPAEMGAAAQDARGRTRRATGAQAYPRDTPRRQAGRKGGGGCHVGMKRR